MEFGEREGELVAYPDPDATADEIREEQADELGVEPGDVRLAERDGGLFGYVDPGVAAEEYREERTTEPRMERQGLFGLAVDEFQERADDRVRDWSGGEVGVSDDWTSTEDFVAEADFDEDVADDLSRGGFLSEDPDDDSGLLPGQVFGADISEERIRGAADRVDSYKDTFDENEDITVFGSDAPERALEGAASAGVDLLNVPQHVLTAETAAEVGQNTPGAVGEYGAAPVAETSTAVGREVGSAIIDEAQEDPVGFVSGTAFGYATGAAAGRVAGQYGRAARDRVRTAGGDRVDAEDLADPDVVRHAETDGAEGTRFPGADNPELYQADPAEAVRRQADEYTPTEVDEYFDTQGVEEGSVMTKGLDVEPEGPGSGRADTGFTSAPDEVSGDFAYETPGSFFGPELSPNFLRTGGEARFSFRPGLPDFGNRPTGVLARTDVENPDADDLAGFNLEMRERAGETTAYTKPASEVNTGEIEAIVPPGGEFAPVRGGGLFTDIARRAGIGSDFYTEVGGRRVPLRTVAPADRTPDADVDVGAGGGLFGGGRGGGSAGESLDYYAEPPEPPVDRPLPAPVVPGDPEVDVDAGPTADAEQGSLFDDAGFEVDADASPMYADYDAGVRPEGGSSPFGFGDGPDASAAAADSGASRPAEPEAGSTSLFPGAEPERSPGVGRESGTRPTEPVPSSGLFGEPSEPGPYVPP
ncbi:MAG: hypothetical protein ACOCSD_08835, partial [Halolamina sp.]